MRLSYVTANLIGQPSGFSGDTDWGKLDAAMISETTPETFRAICRKVKGMGFDGIEIYTGHCSYLDRDVDFAKAIAEVCGEEGLAVVGYAGGFGRPDGTREDFKRTFAMCKALGAALMTGGIAGPPDWSLCAEMLREEGLIIAYENHPETTPEEILAKIGPYEDVIKVGLDTGNLAAQGGDALEAAKKLLPFIAHLHLKDVREVGAHNTVAVGKGVAKAREALLYLVQHGYDRWATIEHEPFDRDPDPEVAESLKAVQTWLSSPE
ncbi:MAG: sugar phosphate isomerase/epimerase family protein [Planctomycetota bacterium]|jgi:sugar phosphate isomerase/epimerase